MAVGIVNVVILTAHRQISSSTALFKLFELYTVMMKLLHSNLAIYNSFRPPESAIQFLFLFDQTNLTQHVSFPTYRHPRTLDLIVTSANYTLFSTVILFQYIEHHSAENTLLSVQIIKAESHQQVNCLTLLDLSVDFDTIDHSIILERLSSWFGISSTAFCWIKSYLLNSSFYVNIEKSKSSASQLI
jgi:hypothetical protein